MSHITRTCGLASRANDLKALFRGVCQYDIGAEYYDDRYKMTFEKFSNGISFMYRPKPNGVSATGVPTSGPYPFTLFNGGQVYDTTPNTDIESHVLCRFTIPGGTLVHKNLMSMSISMSGVGGALAGTVIVSLNNNLAANQLFPFVSPASGTTKTMTLSLIPFQSNILELYGASNPSGIVASTRTINLLSDLDIQISFDFTTPNLGRSVKLNGLPTATYTAINNTLPTLPISSYRNPLETPFADDSFWNTRLGAGAIYVNPTTDQEVIHLRDPWAGFANKSGSKSNFLFIQGLAGDAVPFHYTSLNDPVCDFKVYQYSGAGIRPNTPWPYRPFRYLPFGGANSNAGASFKMKSPQKAYISGQNTDSFVVIYSGDKRFANEIGRYGYTSRNWKPSTRYENFNTVVPAAGLGKFSYKNTGPKFDSGITEPVWPTVVGQTVRDGTGIGFWTCQLYSNDAEPTEPFVHGCGTLYVADLYSLGISNKFFPWYSNTETNKKLVYFAANQFHRAGGLPSEGGIVRTAELNNGFIPHLIAMQASNAILRTGFFSVVSGVIGGNTFVVRPRPPIGGAATANSRYTQMNYASIFAVRNLPVAHGGTFNSPGLPYTTTGTSSYDPLTNYTTFTVNEVITTTSPPTATSPGDPNAGAETIALGHAAFDARKYLQFQWPNVTADGAAPEQYKGLSVLGTLFAIPKTVDITTLTHPNTGARLTAEGLMVARAFQDFGGLLVDQTGDSLGLFQVDADISGTQLGNLSADRLTLVNALVRVSNYSKQLVRDAQLLEQPLPYQKPLIPFY